MPTPSEKLAESLERLKKLQSDIGFSAIRSSDISRTDRERLLKNGFLQEVIKGWYIPSRPNELQGESTGWYTSFWSFCTRYLSERFDKEWSLSPEQSLLLHSGNWSVPNQLLVRSPKARNKVTHFPYDTSVFDIRAVMPDKNAVVMKEGLRLFSLESALISCSGHFFSQHHTDARAVLSMLPDASSLLSLLLKGGHSTIAGRLAGAFRNIGRIRIADDIVSTMTSAGYSIRENDPFEDKPELTFARRDLSPYVNRIRLMWQAMREPVLENFLTAPGLSNNPEKYIRQVEENYANDAYNSLSIEGYQVTPELIERVRSGNWNPDSNALDQELRNALAARGYWQSFQEVEKSIKRILKGDNAGVIAEEGHGTWYRELFAPSITAGLLRPSDLAGYRNNPVYIRRSMHVPPNHEAVRDLMPAFFELLEEEKEAAVRAVLGHFVFVYIHPYSDGNGRIGRFLMNVMLASGGYPWTIVPVEKRQEYMAVLELASVGQDIVPFASFIGGLVTNYG